MRGAVLYGPRDIRFEERDAPKIIEPTDAIIRGVLTRDQVSPSVPLSRLQSDRVVIGHE